MGYTSRSQLLQATSQAVAASQTNQVVSEVFTLTSADASRFRADLTAESTTGTVTVMLQSSHDGTTWIDGKDVSVADGTVTVNYLPEVAGDQTYLPLPPLGRFAVTTAGASGTTISAIRVARST
jgi:hypothetical protein